MSPGRYITLCLQCGRMMPEGTRDHCGQATHLAWASEARTPGWLYAASLVLGLALAAGLVILIMHNTN